MGNILNLFKRNQEFRILMQGLDAAGKTTILYRLKLGEVVTTIPTIGFNVETVEKNNLHLTVWDVGGRGKMRALHRHYYPNTNALVFVIDGTDRERLADAKYELDSVLKEDDLRNAVLLVLVNKQDLRQAMSSIEVSEVLQLHKVKHRCNVFPITAITGEGLDEAFDWLSEALTLKDSSTNQSANNPVNKWSGYWLKSWKAVKNVFAS